MANNVTVNFTSVLTATDPLGVGLVITEFGGNPPPIVGNSAWFDLLKALAPGHMRCSIAYYGGNPSYGAGGSPGEQGSGGSTAAALINAIKATGAIPLVSYNGNTSDNGNLNGSDAGNLVHFFNDNGGQNGGPVKYWSVGNEPDNTGGVGPYESEAPGCVTAMLAASSGIVVGIPAAAYWDLSLLEWAAGVSGIGALSYHAYDALDSPGSDNGGGGFYETQQYFSQTGTMRSLRSGVLYGVEEFNANSSAGSGTTLAFTTSWQETCWIADVLGQLLSSGAHGTVYGDSNAALSVISDGTGFTAGTPMPAYWGLGIWTGMNGQFSKYSANMVSATTTFPDTSVSVYASDNGKIVLVNKSTSAQSLTIGVTLSDGVTSGTYNVWATDYASPTSAITEVLGTTNFSGGVIDYTIPAGTVVSLNVTGTGSGGTTPAAPTDLIDTAVTSSSASLAWGAPSGVVNGYYVYQNSALVATVTTGTSATISGLAASTTYTFNVAAYNTAGTGAQSGSLQITTEGTGTSGTLTQPGGVAGDQFQTAAVGPYLFQLNQWNSTSPYSCDYSYASPSAAFTVASSSESVATNGAPASYSSIISGNHVVGSGGGYKSSVNTQFPIQNSAMTSGEVTTSVSGTVPESGAWDFAYDNWYATTPNPSSVSNNGSGLEMMIWLNHYGGIQPAGSAGPTVTLDGIAWTVWIASGGPISYVANTPITSVTNLDLLPFTNDAISRGMMTSAWYLIDVEMGFEIWDGGAGLAINAFTCTNGSSSPPPPPPPPPPELVVGLPSVPGLSVPGATSPGQPLFVTPGSVSALTALAPGVRMSLAGTVSTNQNAVINSVQSGTAFTYGATSITVDLGTGVTLGNLIVVCLTAHEWNLTVTPPSGWSEAGSGASLSGTLQTQIYYLVVGSAQAGETSFTFRYSASQTEAATIREWYSSTGWKASPVDQTTSATAFGSGTISTGTSGSTTQGAELAVAALSWGNTGQAESALTSGYTSGNLAISSGSCSIREAYQVLSSPGTQACQETVSGSQNTIGFLATFEPSYHYIETLITYTSIEANPANAIRKGIAASASVLSQALRTIPHHISASLAVAAPKALKGVGRVLRGLVSSGSKDTAVDIGYTEYGPLHIVFPGGGKTAGGLNPVVFNPPRVSLRAVFAFAKSLPRPQMTLAGKVYYGVLKVLLPNPSATLAGKDTHNVLRAVVPAMKVPLAGRVTRQGALSIALSSRQMGFLYRDVLAPEDLTPARWLTGQAGKRWKSNIPETGWNVMGYGTVQVSHLSTEYVLVPIAATRSGVSYNPTSDVVQFAFMPNAVQQPQNTDWVGGSWDVDSTNILYPYSAKCLVGPAGVITLPSGSYVIFVKIEDSPETPVLTAGQLTVN